MRNAKVAGKQLDVGEANRLLPLVSAIVSDIADLHHRIQFREDRLSGMSHNRELSQQRLYSEERAQMVDDIESDKRKLGECLAELEKLGLITDSDHPTVVRFPGIHEGQEVWFCWRIGQDQIQSWSLRSDSADWVPLGPGKLDEQRGPIEVSAESD